jgi:hypothetical protein
MSVDVGKGSKQQRRLSGVCSLGGAAVELDMQFPSTGMSPRFGKGSMGQRACADATKILARLAAAKKLAFRL